MDDSQIDDIDDLINEPLPPLLDKFLGYKVILQLSSGNDIVAPLLDEVDGWFVLDGVAAKTIPTSRPIFVNRAHVVSIRRKD